jgi:DNA-binding response OmpR family regulator
MKLLIIEDEIALLPILVDSLSKEHYIIETASEYYAAREKIEIYEYDCILLDIMLPNGSGLHLLELLKKIGKSVNVIIISAKNSLDDKLNGLELGADDYLTKPFHIAELNARIKAVMRRKNWNGKETLEYGNIIMDLKEHTFSVNSTPILLNRKEFNILNYLLVNKNRLVTRSALAEHVWGDNIDQADNFNFIYYQIKNLRKKLNDAAATIEIEAIYGIGYKLIQK